MSSIDNNPRIWLNDCEQFDLPVPPSQRFAQPEEEEIDEELTVSVYPNPNQGDLTVLIVGGDEETGYQFYVMDVLGKAVYSSKLGSGLNDLQLPLAAGTYLYTVVKTLTSEVIEQGNVVVMQK